MKIRTTDAIFPKSISSPFRLKQANNICEKYFLEGTCENHLDLKCKHLNFGNKKKISNEAKQGYMRCTYDI